MNVLPQIESERSCYIVMMVMGIKSACNEFNSWEGAARIYYNKESNEVWTEIYHSDDLSTKYNDSAIIEVYSKTLSLKHTKITPVRLSDVIAKIIRSHDSNNFYLHI